MGDSPGFYDEDSNGDSSSGSSSRGIIVLMVLLFLPSVIVALCYYFALRVLKHRPSYLVKIALVVSLLSLIAFFLSSAGTVLVGYLTDFNLVTSNPQGLIAPIILLSLSFGSLLGAGLVKYEERQIKKNPHRLQDRDDWAYDIKYRKNIFDKKRIEKNVAKIESGELIQDNRIPMGVLMDPHDEKRDGEPIYRYESESVKHTLITGGTGSGKTWTIMNLMHGDIANSEPVIAIDFKRNPENAAKMAKWAKDYGGEFYHFVHGEEEDYDIPGNDRKQCFFDPLDGMSRTTIKETLLNMREYDMAAEAYKNEADRSITILIRLLQWADRDITENIEWEAGPLMMIYTGATHFVELLEACLRNPGLQNDPVKLDEIASYADEYNAGSRKNAIGLFSGIYKIRAQLQLYIMSDYGRWIGRGDDPDRTIDILEACRTPGSVVLFSLSGDSEKEFAKGFGSLIMGAITAASGILRESVPFDEMLKCNIYLDEFQALHPEIVRGLIEKGRSSKFATTLSVQTLSQIQIYGKDNVDIILGSISNAISHIGSSLEDGERFASMLGKEKKTIYSFSSKHDGFFMKMSWDNRRNKRVQQDTKEDWRYDPSNYTKLSSPGQTGISSAIYLTKEVADPRWIPEGGGGTTPCARMFRSVVHKEVQQTLYEIPKEESFMSIGTKASASSIEELEQIKIAAAKEAYEKGLDLDGYQYEEDEGGFLFEHNDEGFYSEPESEVAPEVLMSDNEIEDKFVDFVSPDDEDDGAPMVPLRNQGGNRSRPEGSSPKRKVSKNRSASNSSSRRNDLNPRERNVKKSSFEKMNEEAKAKKKSASKRSTEGAHNPMGKKRPADSGRSDRSAHGSDRARPTGRPVDAAERRKRPVKRAGATRKRRTVGEREKKRLPNTDKMTSLPEGYSIEILEGLIGEDSPNPKKGTDGGGLPDIF